MPLLDHFHPPLSQRRHWESFHAQWAACIASALNGSLPQEFFAESQVHTAPRIEVDVAAWNESATAGGVTTATRAMPKLLPADLVLPATFPPEFGVQVYETSGGPTLVAAIELVSPGNKDREETRRAFAAKCAGLIQRAIGVMVVDIVTSRQSEPFPELMALVYPGQPLPAMNPLTVVSYRPARVNERDTLEIRHRSLAIGEPLPVLPLALGGLGWIEVDLEATYEDARERSRL